MPHSRMRSTSARPTTWRYTFPPHAAGTTPLRAGAAFRTEPIEWFKKVEAGEAVNPCDPTRPVKPYRPDGE